MTREEARELLDKHLKRDNMIKHCIASEAIMRGVAARLGCSEDEWGIAGLLHDIDFELTENEPEKHGIISMNLLPGNISPEIREAIRRHNENNGSKRENLIDHALSASESLTGLIIATALVYPDKKISSVKVKSVVKRMKEKAFARNVSRESIMECEKLGISLDEFVAIGIESMLNVSNKLEL